MILEPPKIKSATVSTVYPSICHEVMGQDAMILVFWMLSFKPIFSLSSFTFIKRLFSFSLSAIGWCHLHVWGYWYFSRHLDSSLCFIQPSVLRESFPRQVDRKSWGPQGERGLEFSRRKKGQTFHSLCRPGPGNWSRWKWGGNRQEGQGSPNGGNSLQVSDIFISLKRQEEQTSNIFFLLYTNLKGGFS